MPVIRVPRKQVKNFRRTRVTLSIEYVQSFEKHIYSTFPRVIRFCLFSLVNDWIEVAVVIFTLFRRYAVVLIARKLDVADRLYVAAPLPNYYDIRTN